MTGRERLRATLDHRQPDRVCVDFGGTAVTGMAASTVRRLREAVLGATDFRVKVIEPYQMLGEIDDELRRALAIDVVGVPGRKTMFGIENTGWKPFQLFDGTPVLVPGGFNPTTDADGDLLICPEGDLSVPPSGRMPRGGFYFDVIIRQQPIMEDRLDPQDNVDCTVLSREDLAYVAAEAERVSSDTDCGVVIGIPGAGFGDIARVPGPGVKHPKGIRDVEEWYVSTVTRRDYVYEVFQRQCEIALANVDLLAQAVGDRAQVAFTSGTDFGTQRGPFMSLATYRDLYKPFHTRVNDRIHRKANWKTFLHTCGGVYEMIPDFVEAGFDILNPVQCSAARMDPKTLKREFGDHIVFWGGGVDTQKTLPYGTPREVYREVRERIDIFNDGGGFVFNAIHNVQARTPVENLLAMFQAVRDSAGASG